MVQKSHIRKETILCILFVISILIMRLWNISELNAPFMFDDEMGYWSHAANLAGLSWTEVTRSWYSYGYSILLVPLFGITHNMKILYRMAIVLNALMGIAGFVLGKAILREIDEQCDEITSMFISFTAACYSAYIFQSNIAWAETFIYTWFMLIVWSAVKFFKRRTWVNTVLFTVECSFLYIIHNRCIVIFIAYAIVLCYMVIKRKIDWKKAVTALVIIAGIFVLNTVIKAELNEMVWRTSAKLISSDMTSDSISSDTTSDSISSDTTSDSISNDTTSNRLIGNDIASQSSKMELLFHLDGWKTLICSLSGKLWYLLSSTLMLAYFGSSYIVKKFISGIQTQKKDKTDDIYLFYIFLSLFICGTIAVTTIVMTSGVMDYYTQSIRLDYYFYGRYSDVVSGILILFGLVDVMHNAGRKKWLTECAVGLILYLVCGSILYLQIRDIVNFYISTTCAPGIYFTRKFVYIQYFGIILVLYLVGSLFFCLADGWKRQIQMVKTGIVSFIAVIIFVSISQNAYICCIQGNQEYYEPLNEICEILNDNLQYPIYYKEINTHNIKQAIRTRVVEGNIKYDLSEEPDDNFFVVTSVGTILDTDLSGENMYYVVKNEEVMLLAIGDELAETVRQKGYPCYHMNEVDFVNMLNVRMDLADRKYDKEIKIGEDLSVMISLQNDDKDMISIANFKISYHIYDAAGNTIVWDGNRYKIEEFLSETEIPVTIAANNFEAAGEYVVEIDIVEEGVAWLSQIGGETIWLNVTAQ